MNSWTDLVVTWGRKEIAEDLGVPVERARGWERFDKFPAKYWRRALEKAPYRNIEITPDLLIDIAAGR